MTRLTLLALLATLPAGCGNLDMSAVTDRFMPSSEAAPDVREFPVQDAACVQAVRQQTRAADIRIIERFPQNNPQGGTIGLVVYTLQAPDGARYRCTANASGETGTVSPLLNGVEGSPEPGAPLSGTWAQAGGVPSPAAGSQPASDAVIAAGALLDG